MIAGVGRLLQKHVMALGLHGHQAQPAGTRCILGHGDVCGGHGVGQTPACLSAGRHHGLLHVAVDLLLRPIGGRDKALKAGEWPQQTHQANATRPHFWTHQGYPEHQTMQKSQPWGTVDKGHNGRRFVQPFLIRPPCLKRAAGHVKHLGRLTLGHPLGFTLAIALTLLRPFEALPALMAIRLATLRVLDDCSHRDRLFRSFACVCVMAKDGEVACWFQASVWSSL